MTDERSHPARHGGDYRGGAGVSVTISNEQALLAVLYGALKRYERGEFRGANVGVGLLSTPLSRVYIEVEQFIKKSPPPPSGEGGK